MKLFHMKSWYSDLISIDGTAVYYVYFIDMAIADVRHGEIEVHLCTGENEQRRFAARAQVRPSRQNGAVLFGDCRLVTHSETDRTLCHCRLYCGSADCCNFAACCSYFIGKMCNFLPGDARLLRQPL